MKRSQSDAITSKRDRNLECLVVVATAMVFSALYAWAAGQDLNWDQRNYHIYSVHAWLHGTTFWHLAPAQIQSWLNPLVHLIQYSFIMSMPPVIAGVSLGALAGANAWPLWVLFRRLQGWGSASADRFLACAALATALSGPMYLAHIGTTLGEYLCTPFLFAALVAIMPGSAKGTLSGDVRSWFFSGLMMGVACGLKLTNLVYAIGLTIALIVTSPSLAFGRTGSAYALAGILGTLTTGGAWGYALWREYGNPMFPFYNAIFKSPLYAIDNFANVAFIPRSPIVAAVKYPALWALGLHPTSEVPFRDARFAVLFALLSLALALHLYRWMRRSERDIEQQTSTPDERRFWFLAAFIAISYLTWLWQFGIHRYALPLEMLSAFGIAYALRTILRDRSRAAFAFAVIATCIIVWTRPPYFGRVPYGSNWFRVEAPPSAEPVLYVMLTSAPMAYIIPFMPTTDRFVRVDGNMPLTADRYLGVEVKKAIQAHKGAIRTLLDGTVDQIDRPFLRTYGLQMSTPQSCAYIVTTMDRLLTCELIKLHPEP